MLNGILLINKPKFITSYKVISILKKKFNQKKIGHAGTLDPIATGVLPILFGNATKISSFLMSEKKEYIAIIKLGYETNTQDITGNIINKSNNKVTLEQFNKTLFNFMGLQNQIPSIFSAIKINGQKLYKIAHLGQTIDIPARKIIIYDIQLIYHDISQQEFIINVKCSKGTYIRTLCNDIGKKLNTYGTLKNLLRISIGDNFNIKKSYLINDILSLQSNDNLNKILLPIDIVFNSLPIIYLNKFECFKIQNGIDILLNEKYLNIKNSLIKIKNENQFLMLAKIKYIENKIWLTLHKNFVILKDNYD